MAKLKNITAMFIFGTIGLFVANIALPSSVIALARALAGVLFIGLLMLIRRQRLDLAAIRRNLLLLTISGVAMGFNWILLFEAYRYTTIAVATLCYYMAPVFIILLSPLIMKERLTPVKLVCAAAAVFGEVLISGVLTEGGISSVGVIYGFFAALLYCGVVMINKFLRGISSVESTLVQLAAAGAVMIPYTLLTEDVSALRPDTLSIVMLVIVGVVHTGFAYLMYFTSVQALPVQTTAIFSYIDPVTAIILSTLILAQPITWLQLAGTVLILGATLCANLYPQLAAKAAAKKLGA